MWMLHVATSAQSFYSLPCSSPSVSGVEVEGREGLLYTFNMWRHANKDRLPAHDSGQLLSGLTFTSGIRGLAGVGAMCHQSQRYGWLGVPVHELRFSVDKLGNRSTVFSIIVKLCTGLIPT